MKRHPKMFIFALLILAAAFFPVAAVGSGSAELPQQKAAAEEEETPYDEVEFGAYENAVKEPNLEKRGTMLLDFIQKYPKSALMSYIKGGYENLLRECSQAKQYALLEPHAEKWLKIYPNDINTLAYIAEAAQKLGNDQKYVQRLEEIYTLSPQGNYAVEILQTYRRIKIPAKINEWTDKVFKMPEYEADFGLRFDYVQKSMEAKNSAKAAEYAHLTLKSADLVKEPSREVQEQLRKVRYACHLVIGTNLYDEGKFAESIKSLQQALRIEKDGEPYYYIGMCQWKQDQIEEATLSFARAELQGGSIAPQAKEKVEQLYKALHNGNLTGIDKVYRKAKEESAP
jgi:tetratricopeptide (TPR) repeat protein